MDFYPSPSFFNSCCHQGLIFERNIYFQFSITGKEKCPFLSVSLVGPHDVRHGRQVNPADREGRDGGERQKYQQLLGVQMCTCTDTHVSLWSRHERANPSESATLWWRCKWSNRWKSRIRKHLSYTALASVVIPGGGGGGGGVLLMHIFGLWEESGPHREQDHRENMLLLSERPQTTGGSKLEPSCYNVTDLPTKTCAVQLYSFALLH